MSNVFGAGMANVGMGMLEKLFTNMSETDGTGARRREAEYRARSDYDQVSLNQQRADLAAKVQLARDIGIHPSVILGSPAASPSLVGVSTSGPTGGGDYGIRSGPSEYDQAMQKLNLENQQLHNDMLRLQKSDYEAQIIARQNQTGLSSPVAPFVMKPEEITMSGSDPGVNAGIHPAMRAVRMPGSGEVVNIPNQDLIETGEILPIVMQFSQATGIPVDTLYTLASLGLLAIPGGMVARGAYSAYKGYRAFKSAASAAPEAARQARRQLMRKGGK